MLTEVGHEINLYNVIKSQKCGLRNDSSLPFNLENFKTANGIS